MTEYTMEETTKVCCSVSRIVSGELAAFRKPKVEQATQGAAERLRKKPDLSRRRRVYIGTAPVDTYESNGYGLYNMAGNVWEWCSDWFSPRYHLETSEE